MDKGYVQIYTGNGKGKTTAALGLALRACGQGLRVKVLQFLKSRDCGELTALMRLGDIEVLRGEESSKFSCAWTDQDRAVIREESKELMARAMAWLRDDQVDVLIVDEALGALACQVIDLEDIHGLLDMRGEHVEVVITGRDAPQDLIDRADLVTEMVPIKHYYDQGVKARKGIEY